MVPMDFDLIRARAAKMRDDMKARADQMFERVEHLLQSPEGRQALELAFALASAGDDARTAPEQASAMLGIPSGSPPDARHPPKSFPGIRNVIRLSARDDPDRISVDTVWQFIHKHYPQQASTIKKPTISHQLRRMAEKTKELRVQYRGTGNQPAIYQAVSLREVAKTASVAH